MRRPYNFIYPLFFAVVTGFGMLVGIVTNSDTYANNVAGAGESSSDSKFEEVMNLVESHYVDSVNTKKLTKVAIQNMLEEMDPHSVYIPAKRRERMNSELEGNFEGIGIQFNIIHDTIAVISPIEGGPSEKLGIQTGDKIQMSLSVPESNLYRIQVKSIQGKSLYRKGYDLKTGTHDLNLSMKNAAKGIYIISVIGPKDVISKRIMLK